MGSTDAVLADTCVDGQKDDNWAALAGAVNEEAELILSLGCPQNVKIIQIKNLERNLGGTEQFSIFVSEYNSGQAVILYFIYTIKISAAQNFTQDIVSILHSLIHKALVKYKIGLYMED